MTKQRSRAGSIPDADWYWDNEPCRVACPVHTDAGAYVTAIADGRFEDAYRIARAPNPFPSVCGRVCAAPCESMCRRGALDGPVAIRSLKRFVSERFGAEAVGGSTWGAGLHVPPATLPSVGIVGGGPAGLSAAHDLRLLGHPVTIYEASPTLGGMMCLGIPPFRLPRDLLEREIGEIVALGVEVQTSCRVGTDISFDALLLQHAAVFVAVGAARGRDLSIPGHDLDGVVRAIELLLSENQGFRVELGARVVVIGGGNVAMDAARTVLRACAEPGRGGAWNDEADSNPEADSNREADSNQEADSNPEADSNREADSSPEADSGGGTKTPLQASPSRRSREVPAPAARMADAEAATSLDVARAARRFGAREVTVLTLEAREEMAAAREEVREAEREGVRFLHRQAAQRILGSSAVEGIEVARVVRAFDDGGHLAPELDRGDITTLAADTVVLAVGQVPDLGFLQNAPIRTAAWGGIEVEPGTLATSHPKVWAGGDVAFGPRYLITAIADGQRAASGIHTALTGRRLASQNRKVRTQTIRHPSSRVLLGGRGPRTSMPTLPSHRRVGPEEVELGFDGARAQREGSRCLGCFEQLVLHPERCILCGLCVDVCPHDCLSIVRADEDGRRRSALILDETLCIRCSLCAQRCPAAALGFVRAEVPPKEEAARG